ncbi:WD40 repeat domain-containing protein [Nostoc sp. UCD121]|nr:WD40 repeat domain-containing protein [Nostoc sp. UCD120]MBC1281079.1 WD40 repeat domain-containing protein [Nostoc sp. UCD121]
MSTRSSQRISLFPSYRPSNSPKFLRLAAWNIKTAQNIFNLYSNSQRYYDIGICLIPLLLSLIIILKVNFILVIFGLNLTIVLFIYFCQLAYDSATAILISPDGKYLISGYIGGTIKVWNIKTKKFIFNLKGHSKSVNAVAITSNGKYLISGSKDKTIKVWNLENRKQLFTLTDHSASVNTVAITPDDKWIISGSDDKTVKIWDLENQEEIFTFRGHTESVNAVTITPDGKVISASSDKTLQVLDLETQTFIAKFVGESGLLCCAVAPDGATIMAGSEFGQVHFLRLEGIETQP